MGAMQPESGSGIGADQDSAFAQAGFPNGMRSSGRLSAVRIISGVIWGVLALIFGAGGVGLVTIGNVAGAVLCFVMAVLAAWYDVRVWTSRARLLLLFVMTIRERPDSRRLGR